MKSYKIVVFSDNQATGSAFLKSVWSRFTNLDGPDENVTSISYKYSGQTSILNFRCVPEDEDHQIQLRLLTYSDCDLFLLVLTQSGSEQENVTKLIPDINDNYPNIPYMIVEASLKIRRDSRGVKFEFGSDKKGKRRQSQNNYIYVENVGNEACLECDVNDGKDINFVLKNIVRTFLKIVVSGGPKRSVPENPALNYGEKDYAVHEFNDWLNFQKALEEIRFRPVGVNFNKYEARAAVPKAPKVSVTSKIAQAAVLKDVRRGGIQLRRIPTVELPDGEIGRAEAVDHSSEKDIDESDGSDKSKLLEHDEHLDEIGCIDADGESSDEDEHENEHLMQNSKYTQSFDELRRKKHSLKQIELIDLESSDKSVAFRTLSAISEESTPATTPKLVRRSSPHKRKPSGKKVFSTIISPDEKVEQLIAEVIELGNSPRKTSKQKRKTLDKNISELLICVNVYFDLDLLHKDFIDCCTKLGLTETISVMLHHFPNYFQTYLKLSENPLNKTDNEGIILEVLSSLRYTLSDIKVYAVNELGQNLLHTMVLKNYFTGIIKMFELDYEMTLNAILQRDVVGNNPVAYAIMQRRKELSTFLIEMILEKCKLNELEDLVLTTGSKDMNILHFCAGYDNALLIKKILDSPRLRDIIKIRSLSMIERSGRNPLMMCKDEDIIIKYLPLLFSVRDGSLLTSTYKGNGGTIAHSLARNNFSRAMNMYLSYCNDMGWSKIDILKTQTYRKNNCLMQAALGNNSEIISTFLSHIMIEGSLADKEEILHHKNYRGQSLLEMVMWHKHYMLVPQFQLLAMEKEVHKDYKELANCFKNNLNLDTSEELHRILNDVRAMYPKTSLSTKLIWLKTFIIFFLLPLSVLFVDISFDALLVYEYSKNISWTQCDEEYARANKTVHYQAALCTRTKFVYSSMFLLAPWVFYLVEFYHNSNIRRYKNWIVKESNICMMILIKLAIFIISLFYIIFWPIVQQIKKCWYHGLYEIQTGINKIKAKENADRCLITCSRAHIIEVAIESTFQPMLQLYLLLPVVTQLFQDISLDTTVDLLYTDINKAQFWSVVTSVISLAWSFTFYKASVKKGALDFDVNCPGRSILLLANLLQITGRLLALVVFAYCFGAGQFLPLMVAVLYHVTFMAILHFSTSNFPKAGRFNASVILQCFLNGLANIYKHSWIVFSQQNEKNIDDVHDQPTKFRQLLFEGILLIENIVIIAIAYYFALPEPFFKEIRMDLLVWIILGFHFSSLILKCIYYKQCHTWSVLNGGPSIFKMNYLCCGHEGVLDCLHCSCKSQPLA